MSLQTIFFPEESRGFWGKRWINVLLRSLHLCGVGVYTGGVFFNVAPDLVLESYVFTAITGLIMMGIDIYSNGKWVIQNRGWLIILKVVLLGLLPHIGIYKKWGVIGIILLSSLVSHATADFRYFSPLHGKKI